LLITITEEDTYFTDTHLNINLKELEGVDWYLWIRSYENIKEITGITLTLPDTVEKLPMMSTPILPYVKNYNYTITNASSSHLPFKAVENLLPIAVPVGAARKARLQNYSISKFFEGV